MMTKEAINLVKSVLSGIEFANAQRLQAGIVPGSDPPRMYNPVNWYCDPGINSDCFSESVRQEVENELHLLGYETMREKRMKSGQRLRGLWVRKK